MKCPECGGEVKVAEDGEDTGLFRADCEECGASCVGKNSVYEAIYWFYKDLEPEKSVAVGMVVGLVLLPEEGEEKDIEMAIKIAIPDEVSGTVALVRVDADEQIPVGYYAVLRGKTADQLLDGSVE